jgi:hypothetical protein
MLIINYTIQLIIVLNIELGARNKTLKMLQGLQFSQNSFFAPSRPVFY